MSFNKGDRIIVVKLDTEDAYLVGLSGKFECYDIHTGWCEVLLDDIPKGSGHPESLGNRAFFREQALKPI